MTAFDANAGLSNVNPAEKHGVTSNAELTNVKTRFLNMVITFPVSVVYLPEIIESLVFYRFP
ncbi:hypothetical protein PGH45_06390 [Legionella pneumophila]|nr:hypothetical protein [Legionella pneumophila]